MSQSREIEARSEAQYRLQGVERAAFVGRLQEILRHWPSADRLARAMGVSPSAFRKWLKGEAEPSRERLVALADAARVGVAWLATGEGPPPTFEHVEGGRGRRRGGEVESTVTLERFLVLPKRLETAAAGSGAPSAPIPKTEYIGFRHDWIRAALGIEPPDLVMEIAVGESMTPTIRDGDLLLVNTTDRTISNFGVYVLEIGGERLVKRVQRKLDGSLVLISDNATYEPDQVPSSVAKELTVVGRVVWGGGAL
ncbi:MAG: helix-turn-helix transcriptional regulator [Acetobacteraceae bacterium]|nr:helix-turn-helix transcriptional regulator [Acetobacteraceae bacterium]